MPPQTQQRCSKTPLDFVGPGILRWDGDKSTQLTFNATTVSTGTFPKGSMWRKNPLPRSPTLWSREGPSFEPICQESEACKALADPKTWKNASYASCKCSGHANAANKVIERASEPASQPSARLMVLSRLLVFSARFRSGCRTCQPNRFLSLSLEPN